MELDKEIAAYKRRIDARLKSLHRACAVANGWAGTDKFTVQAIRIHAMTGRGGPISTNIERGLH